LFAALNPAAAQCLGEAVSQFLISSTRLFAFVPLLAVGRGQGLVNLLDRPLIS